jgi:H+/Cl- antiporter ClcA
MLTIAGLATGVGLLSAFVALGLLRLIGFFTNLFFYHRLASSLVSAANHQLGIWVIAIPVAGGLIIGLMARYGSERIRGHGIPEAIEAILLRGSRVEPKVAILKPLSSALSIGSGGPFGAEGPIIMTGGAFGSMAAQLFHLTSAERKTLLVAGAAGGMSATFAAPVSAVILAFELLLFEWKPRSLVPVALASMTAGIARRYLLGAGPLFPTPAHPPLVGPEVLLLCAFVGLMGGVLSALLTASVYWAEDTFLRLPIHWMWWPAIGGLVIGIGGWVFPQALGVGYETIGAFLQGNVPWKIIAGVLIVKWWIWAIALGSGTSGGVLAPLLMIGSALGGVEAMMLPAEGAGFWPLVSMAATLGGTMRSPFTGVIFALELTHDFNMMFPLFVAVMVAYAFTVLAMKRSILTEKVARRGYHLSREYSVDPLEILFVREVMRTKIAALPLDISAEEGARLRREGPTLAQRLFPVVDRANHLTGVVTRKHLHQYLHNPDYDQKADGFSSLILRDPVTAFPDETLRSVVNRMAEHGLTRLPVIDHQEHRTLLGMVSLTDLLGARIRNLEEERRRQKVLRLRYLFRTDDGARKGEPLDQEITLQEGPARAGGK